MKEKIERTITLIIISIFILGICFIIGQTIDGIKLAIFGNSNLGYTELFSILTIFYLLLQNEKMK